MDFFQTYRDCKKKWVGLLLSTRRYARPPVADFADRATPRRQTDGQGMICLYRYSSPSPHPARAPSLPILDQRKPVVTVSRPHAEHPFMTSAMIHRDIQHSSLSSSLPLSFTMVMVTIPAFPGSPVYPARPVYSSLQFRPLGTPRPGLHTPAISAHPRDYCTQYKAADLVEGKDEVELAHVLEKGICKCQLRGASC